MHTIHEWRGKVYQTSQDDGFFDSDEWLMLRRDVFLRDKYRCKRCDKRFSIKALTCHHLRPRNEGGADGVHNLVSLCDECHNYVEVNNLRTVAAIIGSFDAPKRQTAGTASNPARADDDPYNRPNWHKYVYGGKRRSGKR